MNRDEFDIVIPPRSIAEKDALIGTMNDIRAHGYRNDPVGLKQTEDDYAEALERRKRLNIPIPVEQTEDETDHFPFLASILAAKDAKDETLALKQVHEEINPDIDLMKYRLTSGYYRNNAVAHEKALDAYKKALEIQRKFVNVVHDFFKGHDLDKNEVDTMLSRIYSLNVKAAEYNKIMKPQREEDAFVKSGNASQSVIGHSRFSAKGGRRTRHKRSGHKKHSNKKRSGHKRLHKKRMSRRR
jgi:tetratricopeptide (TPR) repeat protein